MVQTSSCYVLEVLFDYPSVPVVRKAGLSFCLAEVLGIGVLVHDHTGGSGVGPVVEDGGCDPWLEDKPSAEVDSTDFIVVVVESDGTLCVPQTAS